METPLISVIVPVYKVEAYLDCCVSSIVNQTYRNLEIILVDDGSPDNCPAMCDQWAKKDNRIKVIHKDNGGLSDARNVGMSIATGEYVGFIDSDDYISPEMYQYLYDRIIKDNSDISACGVEMVFEDGSPPRSMTARGQCVLTTKEALEAIVTESWLKQPVWNKLYKASLIRDIPFPVGKFHEDVFWSYQAIAKATRVSISDTPCYFYMQRNGSIMGTSYSIKRLDAIEAKQRRLHFLLNNYKSLLGVAQIDLLFTCMYHGQLSLQKLDISQQWEVMEILLKVVSNCSIPSWKDLKQLPILQLLWVVCAKINLPLCCRLRNLLKIGL